MLASDQRGSAERRLASGSLDARAALSREVGQGRALCEKDAEAYLYRPSKVYERLTAKPANTPPKLEAVGSAASHVLAPPVWSLHRSLALVSWSPRVRKAQLPSLPNEATAGADNDWLVGAPPQPPQALGKHARPLISSMNRSRGRRSLWRFVCLRVSRGLVPGLETRAARFGGRGVLIALESKGPMGRYTVALTSGPIQAVEHVIEEPQRG